MLKLGLATGGTALVGSPSTDAQLLSPHDRPVDLEVKPSPPTTPFVVPLPIPPVAQPIPVSRLDPPPDPARHQRYDEFPAQKFYEFRQSQFLHSYHPELGPTVSWGYGGITPGPTIHARWGEPLFVRMHNDLPADHVGFAAPSTSTHVHNMHTASESDGFPMNYINPGEYYDHHYAMSPAGGDRREHMHSMWYHDHRMDFTAPNVYAGLSAFFLAFDEEDSGDENSSDPRAWRLPSGKYDVPLMLHDVLFDEKGQAAFDVFNTDGLLGDKFTVNRAIQPYFQVEPRKYRFRIQNGGVSRFYQFFLSTGQPFTVISNDGNMLPRPIISDSIHLSVAQRSDVIIDFSQNQPGDQIYLQNRLEQVFGQGPTGRLLDAGDNVMRFDVVPLKLPDHSRIPEKFRPLPPINLAEVDRERLWVFDYNGGLWTINGGAADMSEPSAVIPQDSTEIWIIRNGGGDWSHPVHIHFEEFQIIEFNGKPISRDEIRYARKDVLTLGPSDEVKLYLKFRDFLGKYVMHCHNVVHEDHAMMVRWDIVPS